MLRLTAAASNQSAFRRLSGSRNPAILLPIGSWKFRLAKRKQIAMGDEESLLRAEFPGEEACYFAPMSIGSAPSTADEGANLILGGVKTATASAFWEYPDGRIPFTGALSVLLDGSRRARAIVRTQQVEVIPFGEVDADFAREYGEGDRTLDWFRSVIGTYYREAAARHGERFSDETLIICEWFTLARRF